MNLEQVCEALDQIATVSGKNDKQALVARYLEDDTFRKVMVYALSPHKRFHLTLPQDTVGLGTNPNPPLFDLLDELNTRASGRDKVDDMLDGASPLAGNLLSRIVNKDLRAGFTAGTVNRARPGTVPEFKVMLAKKYEPRHIKKWPVAVEPKLDGVRVLTYVDPQAGVVRFFSRTGNQQFASLPNIERELPKLNRPYYLDGEVLSGDNFNDTVSAIRKSSAAAEAAQLHVFDVLMPEDFERGKTGLAYKFRRGFLMKALTTSDHIRIVPSELASSHDEVEAICQGLWDAGHEGVVVKPLDGLWEGKRSSSWLKIKGEESVDVPITDVFEGTGKYQGMLGGVVVDVEGVSCRVGGGFSDEDRQKLWADDLTDRLIEVIYHEKTPDGSLRHPRFKCFRPDKEA